MSPRQAAYLEYLKSEHWRLLRRAVIERDGRRCTRCLSTRRLQAHHKFYRGRWVDSLVGDLISLCRPCHKIEHGLEINERDEFLMVLRIREVQLEKRKKDMERVLRGLPGVTHRVENPGRKGVMARIMILMKKKKRKRGRKKFRGV